MSETPAKSGKPWMRILLVISLGLNLLIVGMFVGARYSGDTGPRSAKHAGQWLPLGPYGRAFSKEDRAELRKAFDSRKPWFQKSRSQMRGFGQEMAKAMRVTPFDIAAVASILEQQNEVLTAFQAEGRKLLVERIENMSPEQRAAFADKLEKGMKRSKRAR